MRRFDASQGPRKVAVGDGKTLPGVRFMAWGEETGGGFSLVEHPLPPRTLASPLHRHSREDEYSFVVEGRMGALLGDEVIHVESGELAFKPREQWHAFWNAGDVPCRILEIISPSGFERFFDELPAIYRGASEVTAGILELARGYGVEFKPEATPALLKEHGLERSLVPFP